MTKFKKGFVVAAMIAAGLTATSPAYAQKKMAPTMNHDMMMGCGMMGMMAEMDKMMKSCSKMMVMMDGHHMKMSKGMHKMMS